MSEATVDKSQWLNLVINGQPVQVPPGSTVMDAAIKLKMMIPHFCYHKKLSLAASCRMCLVQVEKIPKPVPACVTTVAEGMRVWTRSETAIAAQRAVISFLMINHPLDCPVCDQAGECYLQENTFGYGDCGSKFVEVKRVVAGKNLGALVSAAEMSRCIQCTRCIRFADEIGGKQELGMIHRGDRSEVVPFVGESYTSEISGNVIDLCPVGALTSKPARYTARAWELSSHLSLSPHDAHGTHIAVHTKQNRVIRVVAKSHEAVNECWIADRDRFSYEALNSDQRLTQPWMKKDGVLVESSWEEALPFAAAALSHIIEEHGADSVGALISPHASLEEMGAWVRWLRGLNCDNLDTRLRTRDFSADASNDSLNPSKTHSPSSIDWLGMPIADIAEQRAILWVGSFLRTDHPLLAIRARHATKKGAAMMSVNAQRADWRMPVAHDWVVPPSKIAHALAQIIVAAQGLKKETPFSLPEELGEIVPSEVARAIAQQLIDANGRAAVLVGSFGLHHENAEALKTLSRVLAALTGTTFGVLPDAANRLGAAWLRAHPITQKGLNARSVLESPRRAYVLFNAEPCDHDQGAVFSRAMKKAQLVIMCSPFKPDASMTRLPDVVLPITPFTEMSGTLINMEGRVQSYQAAVTPLGEARPGWRVIAALSQLMNCPFPESDLHQLRQTFVPTADALNARLAPRVDLAHIKLDVPRDIIHPNENTRAIERVGSVPLYQSDAIVRRAASLQKTTWAMPPRVGMNRHTLNELGLTVNARVRVMDAVLLDALRTEPLSVEIDETLPLRTVRVDTAHPLTWRLSGVSGKVHLEVCDD
ncbi:MAG: NADH-quinone oxidoreductase subunit NuoG [Burkholderiales bacterium]|jgi:NADH-quinone oxidoreductase subunit G|nr:NADH-quinone oxidoreductase subunit NuoG [Burkholderiales bacterium]